MTPRSHTLASRLAAVALLLTAAALPAAAMPQPGPYVGLLPCADCPGTQWRLDLYEDNSFHLRVEYQDRPEARQDDLGRWQAQDDGGTLLLQGQRGAPLRLAQDGPEKLTLLDGAGPAIEAPHRPSLVRSLSLPPLEPQLRLRGLLSLQEGRARLRECVSGRDMAVAMEEGDAAEMERAWRQRAPDGSLLATLEARIVPRVNAEGRMRPTVVVERFERLGPGASCESPAAAAAAPAPLLGTAWRLVRLGAQPLLDEERLRGPQLQLRGQPAGVLNGSGGCNRIDGRYRVEGAGLQFEDVEATRLACAVGMEQEQRFMDALQAARGWRIEGRELELLDAAGRAVARFEAGEAGEAGR